MLTALESRFLERMPAILIDLTKAVQNLSNDVAELNKELHKESKPTKSE